MRTSYHDPDGWPRPLRAPQHAAARFGPSSLTRLQARRALRLFVIGGTWAAGLCLVIGSIVLVVSGANPTKLAPAAVTTPAGPEARSRTQAGSARPLAPSGRPVAIFAGQGDKTTHPFRINGGIRWQIQWAYGCPARMRTGLLVVEDASPGAVGASISEAGTAGHGTTWLDPRGRIHHLIVISTCPWTMKVMQKR